MQLTCERLELSYRHAFRIARGGSTGTTTVLVRLSHDGATGLGEAVPVRYYGWTLEAIETALGQMGAWLADMPADCPDAVATALAQRWPAQSSAVGAVVNALWDLHGILWGVPVAALLGLARHDLGVTSYTIGLSDRAELLAKADAAAEFPILKVKCGGAADIAHVRALREHTGKRLWVDANGGWTVAQAADLAGELATLGVELIEQPVPREELDGLAQIRAVSPLPILADESCHTAADVVRLVGAVDGVNVKFEKTGGLSGALRAIHTARACGLQVMLGCFCASSVALTAAAQLASLVDYPDLDGHLLLAADPFCGMTAPQGRITLPDEPGLGLRRNRASHS